MTKKQRENQRKHERERLAKAELSRMQELRLQQHRAQQREAAIRAMPTAAARAPAVSAWAQRSPDSGAGPTTDPLDTLW